MTRWTGKTITLQVGKKWTYKLELQEESEAGPRTDVVFGREAFSSEQEAKTAGDVHLKAEIEKRSQQALPFFAVTSLKRPSQSDTSGETVNSSASEEDDRARALSDWEGEGGSAGTGKLESVKLENSGSGERRSR